MSTYHAYRNCLEEEVMEADPLKLVTLLYRGATEAVASARVCLRSKDIAGRSRQISRATAILNELALGLNHSSGPDLSRSLAEIYDYMSRRLNEANFQQIDGPLAEVESLLRMLADAWKQCETSNTGQMSAAYSAPIHPQDYQPLSYTV